MKLQISLSKPWLEARAMLHSSLEELGLSSTSSFDLQSARGSLPDPELCPCPYHGAEHCTCQYMVFGVQREGQPPIFVEMHGYEDSTFLAIAQPLDGSIDEGVLALVQHALERLEQTV